MGFQPRDCSNHSDAMPFEKFDLEALRAQRRSAVAKSLRTISVDEWKQIGEKIFPNAGDDWRDLFFEFLRDNPNTTFHHALTSDGVNIVYCRDQDRGIWFLPGSGKGPLPKRGRTIMKEMIEARH